MNNDENLSTKLPVAGEIWQTKINMFDESPWPVEVNKNDIVELLIKDVKEGWVRYDSYGHDRRFPTENFIQMYELKTLSVEPLTIEHDDYLNNNDYVQDKVYISDNNKKQEIAKLSFGNWIYSNKLWALPTIFIVFICIGFTLSKLFLFVMN